MIKKCIVTLFPINKSCYIIPTQGLRCFPVLHFPGELGGLTFIIVSEMSSSLLPFCDYLQKLPHNILFSFTSQMKKHRRKNSPPQDHMKKKVIQ